jgi:hypothetical protein
MLSRTVTRGAGFGTRFDDHLLGIARPSSPTLRRRAGKIGLPPKIVGTG